MAEQDFSLPVPTFDNLEFWRRARQRELVLQRCGPCREFTFPPRPTCVFCGSPEREWVSVSGRGTIANFTITHQPLHPSLRGKTPWAVVEVELEEGVRMITNVVNCPPGELSIGVPVEVVFEDVSEQITLPKFRVVGR